MIFQKSSLVLSLAKNRGLADPLSICLLRLSRSSYLATSDNLRCSLSSLSYRLLFSRLVILVEISSRSPKVIIRLSLVLFFKSWYLWSKVSLSCIRIPFSRSRVPILLFRFSMVSIPPFSKAYLYISNGGTSLAKFVESGSWGLSATLSTLLDLFDIFE